MILTQGLYEPSLRLQNFNSTYVIIITPAIEYCYIMYAWYKLATNLMKHVYKMELSATQVFACDLIYTCLFAWMLGTTALIGAQVFIFEPCFYSDKYGNMK